MTAPTMTVSSSLGPAVSRLRLAQPDGLAVAPRRLIAVRLAIVLDAQPKIAVRHAQPVARRGPEARPEFVLIAGRRSRRA